jgi:O-methyltransferase
MIRHLTAYHAPRADSSNSADVAADRYLDLLKRTLTYSLWDEPPAPITYPHWNIQRSFVKRQLIRVFAALAASRGWSIVEPRPYTQEQREAGHLWPMCAHTMIGRPRLDHLHACCETALDDNIPGDFIETGVWRGGACILMRGVLAAYGITDRSVFVADSFCGLPVPDPAYPADAGNDAYQTHSVLAVSRAEVEENFRRYGLLDEQVVFLEGWFKDTLPTAPIDRLAVFRLDGDLYESTWEALVTLYPKLSPGGFCIIDDYSPTLGGKQAVDDYRQHHDIRSPLQPVDEGCVAWRKEERG